MAASYGQGVYGDGVYGFGFATEGYGSGLYGAGLYGQPQVVVPPEPVLDLGGARLFTVPVPHQNDDDEAAVALTLALL